MKFSVLFFVFCSHFLAAQNQYTADSYDKIVVDYEVQYGQSTTQGKVKQKLVMDVYSASDDSSSSKPIVILAHGGYFTMGDKSSFAEECAGLAKKGFVAVSMNYRLIDIEGDSVMTSKIAAIDAIHDMKACVRYFYKDAQLTNTYKVDTSKVFIGGYSAGAITALHYAYANTKEDVEDMGGKELLQYVFMKGGLDGQSGNPGYSSRVHGVINIAGSLHSASLINVNEPPLVSVHGTADLTVPFESGLTGETLVQTEGSGLIHAHADKIGVKNKLIQLDGLDHSAFYYCDDCLVQIVAFLNDLIDD